jgi:ElaB/YqjD/DUF883 family membrane-anchored ribosome-binding protein
MPRRNGSNQIGSGRAAEEFRKRASTLKDDALELGHASRQLAGETIERVKHSAQDYYRRGSSQARAIESAVEDYVRAYPIRSMLIAAAAGFILAKLLSRR